MRRALKDYLVPLIILLAVTLPHLEQGDFRRDTGRYAAVGLYMWNGGNHLAPYLNPDTPYFNKPPLAIMIHGAFLKLFGVHLAVARLPSILAALGVVLMSMMALRQIASRSETMVSGMVLALTWEFFRRTREISLDFWQLFFVMFAVFFVMNAIRKNCRRIISYAGVFLGLGLLCKPLVALGTIPVFALWLVVGRRTRLLPWLFAWTLPVAVLVAAPWHLYMYCKFGHAFPAQYFGREVVARAMGENSRGTFGYFFILIGQTYWPWMLGAAYALYYRFLKPVSRRDHSRDPVLYAGIWLVLVLLMISFFPDRATNYALPVYPMLSWLVAWGLCRVPWMKLRTWYQRGFAWLMPAFILIGIVCAIAPIQFQRPPKSGWGKVLNWANEHHVAPGSFAWVNLDPNDICYFYLKTGVWLRDSRKLGTGETPSPGLFLIANADKLDEALKPLAVFTAENLVIVPGEALAGAK